MNKRVFINSLIALCNQRDENFSLEMDSICLLTSIGYISGSLVKYNEPKNTPEDAVACSFASGISQTSDNDFILLKDVTVQTNSEKFFHKYLYVFTEDIIAVSL